MFKVAYITLGCKVNQYETEKIRELLEAAGFSTVPAGATADIYVINTCSVTSVADGKSRAAIRKAIRTSPDAYIVVAGCYAELEPEQISAIEGVDMVVSNSEKDEIAERLIARFGSTSDFGQLRVRPRMRTRAVVKVQDGCEQFCAYCVIPYARSGKRSRPLADVIAELEELAEFGYKEVVLTGIRLGSYECGNVHIPELVRAAAGVDGIERVRLSSIEPWEVDDALLDAMQLPYVCRHLHIPLQSGDDAVLRAMNRPYNSAEYLRIIDSVRSRIPGIGITTDVIVGFPGETDECFANTCAAVKGAEFSRLHVFRYSPRERTAAASMPNQVDAEKKKERAEKLAHMGKMGIITFAQSMVGRTLDVLVEREDKSSKLFTGFADNYVDVAFSGGSRLKGEVAGVRIISVDSEGRARGELSEC